MEELNEMKNNYGVLGRLLDLNKNSKLNNYNTRLNIEECISQLNNAELGLSLKY